MNRAALLTWNCLQTSKRLIREIVSDDRMTFQRFNRIVNSENIVRGSCILCGFGFGRVKIDVVKQIGLETKTCIGRRQ